MNDVLIEGEPLELIREAFRGMKAQRGSDGWVSVSGRLDPVAGEALVRALHRAEASLPRRLGSTREQHRAAALDEIARRLESGGTPEGATRVGAALLSNQVRATERPEPRERSRKTADVATERFRPREPGARHLSSVPVDDGSRT